MKNSEIKELSTKDIVERIDEEKARLLRFRLNHSITPLDNPNEIKNSRRLVARLKTELTARSKQENA